MKPLSLLKLLNTVDDIVPADNPASDHLTRLVLAQAKQAIAQVSTPTAAAPAAAQSNVPATPATDLRNFRPRVVSEIRNAVLAVLAEVGESASMPEVVLATQNALLDYTLEILKTAGRITYPE